MSIKSISSIPRAQSGVRPRTARPLRLLTATHFLRGIRSLRILRSLRSLRKAALTVEAMAVVYCGPYRLSYPPPPSSLNSLSSLKSLSLSSLNPGADLFRFARRRPAAHRCAGMSRTVGRKHAQGRTCGARPPLRLRGFVPSCETFPRHASRLPYKARIRTHTRAITHAHAYALARGRARAHARALPGSIRNPYGFEMKPV